MSDHSKIEWTDATWNPVTGCTKVSPGCDHCYAETFSERFRGVPGHHFERGFDVQLRPDKLDQPLRWKRPRRVFVNSMSDLFHADIPEMYIAGVFAVMARAPQHTFQVLTKRPGRMRSLMKSDDFRHRVQAHDVDAWPLPNVWLGISAEDQKWADVRIPVLVETPAAVRFVSAEPLLGPINFRGPNFPMIDWIIVGGESGRGARPMSLDWARDIRDQCRKAGVAFHYKQQGSGDGGPKSRRELDGRTWDEFPVAVP
jgi:protein gp37